MDIVQRPGGDCYVTTTDAQRTAADHRTNRPAAPSSAPYVQREPGTRTLFDLVLGIVLWLATWVAIIVIFLLLE